MLIMIDWEADLFGRVLRRIRAKEPSAKGWPVYFAMFVRPWTCCLGIGIKYALTPTSNLFVLIGEWFAFGAVDLRLAGLRKFLTQASLLKRYSSYPVLA